MRVAVIGASISGLYSAYLLAREGVEVEVYEKEKRGQAPKRTLIVTAKIKEILDFDLSDSIVNQINRYELIADGQKMAIQLDNPELVIERKALLELLAQRAEEAGAKIFRGHEVVGPFQNNRGEPSNRSQGAFSLQVIDRESGVEQTIERDIVVLANGLMANVNSHRKLALVQARVLFFQKNGDTNLFRASTCRVWFVPNRTRYFFWLIPESAEVAAVGLIDEDMAKAEELLRQFLDEKKLHPIEFQAALVPEYKGNLLRADRQGFLLAGMINKAKVKMFKKKGEISGAKKEICGEKEGILESKQEVFRSKRFDLNFINKFINNGPNNGSGRLYAVGDAAAQVKMTTVGGVVAGLRGAKAVAAAILEEYNRGRRLKKTFSFCNRKEYGDCQEDYKDKGINDHTRYGLRNLDNYKQAWRELYCELNLHYLARKLLNCFTHEDYARLLRKIDQDEELKRMLGRWTRDDLSRFLFKLLWKRPWLLSFALKKWGHILFS